MVIPGAESVFDVAEWFLDTALNDGEYLQPMKMQYLLFLSQGYYAALTKGGRLIPSVFVATERGPVEPNSYRLYAVTRPPLVRRPMEETVSAFLLTIWRRFGSYSCDYLGRLLATHEPYARAFAKGPGTEISLELMAEFYTQGRRTPGTPEARNLGQTRVMRSQTGKTVAVKKWIPQTAKKT
ncbi:MAG: Panacea domain-containing protein [Alphaproteobacteria bacterium]|jgi:uncharacterized phage-associated protein